MRWGDGRRRWVGWGGGGSEEGVGRMREAVDIEMTQLYNGVSDGGEAISELLSMTRGCSRVAKLLES